MDETLIILGRQPALGLAELESLYGPENIQTISHTAVKVRLMPCSIQFKRLGGAVKLCKILTVLHTTNWKEVERFLVKTAPQHAATMPEGKMQLGLSAYDLKITPQQIIATGLSIKKAIRQSGRSVRLTPNQEPALNSAQVIHNRLTHPNGWELVFVQDGNTIICAQTLCVQDIEAYTLRDRGRPKRDTRVGMLPPKLAQIILNLSLGKQSISPQSINTTEDCSSFPPIQPTDLTVLDPFCGTGVVLQEGMLMGYPVYGTDLEARMITYSEQNMSWLNQTHTLPINRYILEVADATTHKWQHFDTIAAETYLGRPFSSLPTQEVLQQVIRDTDTIHRKFLKNVARQTRPGFRMCIAIPAWQVRPHQFKHLPLIDQINDLGYNRVSFEHVHNDKLLYYREDQVVARELLVITRK